jgi:hypothetical protein
VSCFGKIGNNLVDVPIYSNFNIVRLLSDSRLLDVSFFGKVFYNLHRNELQKLTINDCFCDGIFKNLAEFHDKALPFTLSI